MEQESEVEMPNARKGPITVILSEPIQFGSEVVKEITLKPPKAKHVKTINPKSYTISELLLIASKVSGVPMAVMDELSIADMTKIGDAVGEYF